MHVRRMPLLLAMSLCFPNQFRLVKDMAVISYLLFEEVVRVQISPFLPGVFPSLALIPLRSSFKLDSSLLLISNQTFHIAYR